MTMTREEIFKILADAGATRTHSCCGLNDKLCGTDEWRGNMEAVVKMAYAAGQASGRAACDTPWKEAVIDQLVIAHILAADHEADPRKAVMDLLAYHADIAVDPRVSEAARELVEAEREACAKACESYEEHIEEFRGAEYQGELAGRQAGAMRCAAAIRARGGE